MKRSKRLTVAKVRQVVTTSSLSGKVAEGRDDVYRRVPTYRLRQMLPQMAAQARARAATAQDLPRVARGPVARERHGEGTPAE